MKNILVFATNNAHKLQEVRQILGERFEVRSLKEIDCHEELPETHDTLEGNALEKAQYVMALTALLTIQVLKWMPSMENQASILPAMLPLTEQTMTPKQICRNCCETCKALIIARRSFALP